MTVVNCLFYASPWGLFVLFHANIFFHHCIDFFLAQAEKRTDGVQQLLILWSCDLSAETMWISYLDFTLFYEGVILVTVGFLSMFGNGRSGNPS